jgi:hypothetical protein
LLFAFVVVFVCPDVENVEFLQSFFLFSFIDKMNRGSAIVRRVSQQISRGSRLYSSAAEKGVIPQAPNRTTSWSPKQQPKNAAMTGPRYVFLSKVLCAKRVLTGSLSLN